MTLKEQVERLGPWQVAIEVVDGVWTQDGIRQDIAYNPLQKTKDLLRWIYPQGLEGRSVLECACNSGVHSLAAKEEGAGEVFGFDAREQWVEQARLLHAARGYDSKFAVRTVEQMREDFRLWDLTLFCGIFYHLPDPIAALKLVADRTKETLIINTATMVGEPDGRLVLVTENPEHNPLEGIDGPAWYPTGPDVFKRTLPWLGFPDVRVTYWNRELVHAPHRLGRLEVVARRG